MAEKASLVSAEEETFRAFYDELLDGVQRPVQLAELLFTENVIGNYTKGKITANNREQTRYLLDAVQQQLSTATNAEELMTALLAAMKKRNDPPWHCYIDTDMESMISVLRELQASKTTEASAIIFKRPLNTDKENILHLSVKYKRQQLVLILLERVYQLPSTTIPEVINSLNWDKKSSLHLAAETGHVGIVQHLLKAGTNTSSKDKYDRTPLHIAAINGHQHILKLLITAGADMNSQASNGHTPLHYAVEKGYKDCVSVLITKGASVKIKINGKTPLQVAEVKLAKETDPDMKKAYEQVVNILRNPDQHIAAVKSEARQKITAVMKKYQHQPTINYKSLKCTFTGPPRVGKTTTRMRLMEEIVNISTSSHTASESTLLQKPLTVQMYEKSDIAPVAMRPFQWKKEDLLGEMQLLLQGIQKDEDDSSQDHLKYPVQEKQHAHTLVAEPYDTAHSAGIVSKVMQVLLEAKDKIAKVLSPARRDDHSQRLSLDYVEKLMKDVLEQRGLRDIREMEETVTAYIMDFGGQPEFQEILPLVLRGPALHLVFFNASLCLNDPVHIKFCPQKGSEFSQCIEYDTKYTAIEMLFQIISSLYCLSENLDSVIRQSGQALPCFKPTAVLIGTHIDLGTSVADVSDEIRKFMQHTEFWKKDFLRTPSKCTSVFYPLDNNHGTKDEVEGLQKFIRELIVQRLTSTPLPRSWLLFHIALRHCYEEDGCCTMKQCIDLAAQCNISEEDVQPILQYIHNHIGSVLHYDVPGLSDIVFCEPNKLLEAINRVIILSFIGDCDHPNLAQEIRKTGEVPKELLDQLEAQAVGSSPITNKEVISLLKHFKIITELTEKSKLFVPCLLHPSFSPVELATQDQLEGMDPQPLLIQFKGGYIPISVFSGLAVELITQHEWRLLTENRFRDHLTFISASWSVELIGHSHFLEVRFFKEDEDPDSPSVHECCKKVREILEVAVAKVLCVYEHTKETTFDLGFYCPCTSSGEFEPHFCEYIPQTRMMCSKTQHRHPLESGAVWFRKPKCKEDQKKLTDDAPTTPQVARACDRSGSGETHAYWPTPPPASTATDSLSEEDLVDSATTAPNILTTGQLAVVKGELPHFAKWRRLGECLGLSPEILEEIEDDFHRADERLGQVLLQWLRRNHNESDYGLPTWSTLVRALEPIDHALAMKIQNKHCTNDAPTIPQVATPCERSGSVETDVDQPPPQPSPAATDSFSEEDLGPLSDPPNLLDFLENVATRIPAKWRKVGIALNIPSEDLDEFDQQHHGDEERCYEAVFQAWKNQSMPLQWRSLLKALQTKFVNERLLAEELSQRL